MEQQGRIIKACQLMTGVSKSSGNPWVSQDYVIETHDQYPHRMVFRVFGEDKIKTFNIQEGEELTVSFDIDAHEYNNRWFNDIRAWRVERVQPGQVASSAATPQSFAQSAVTPQAPAQSATVPSAPESDPESDLPF